MPAVILVHRAGDHPRGNDKIFAGAQQIGHLTQRVGVFVPIGMEKNKRIGGHPGPASQHGGTKTALDLAEGEYAKGFQRSDAVIRRVPIHRQYLLEVTKVNAWKDRANAFHLISNNQDECDARSP